MNNNYGYGSSVNGTTNPYNYATQLGPRQQVIKVSGRQGAEMYRMGPDSSALLLDESGSLIWLITTDGAGYKSIYPYDINPHVDPPDPYISQLEQRMTKMEEILNGIAANFTTTQSTTTTNTQPTTTTVDTTQPTNPVSQF